MSDTKTCKLCDQTFVLICFNKVNSRYYAPYCRNCFNAYQRARNWPMYQCTGLTMQAFKEDVLPLMKDAGETYWIRPTRDELQEVLDAGPIEELTEEELTEYGYTPTGNAEYDEYRRRQLRDHPETRASRP
jgi:hypothetical protein